MIWQKLLKQGVWDNDLVGLIFNTIGVSDGMSNGTDGMRLFIGEPGYDC